jgi:hypothetical protein
LGRHDLQIPWRGNAEIAAMRLRCPEIFEPSGHYPYIEQPEAFRTVVSGFLES